MLCYFCLAQMHRNLFGNIVEVRLSEIIIVFCFCFLEKDYLKWEIENVLKFFWFLSIDLFQQIRFFTLQNHCKFLDSTISRSALSLSSNLSLVIFSRYRKKHSFENYWMTFTYRKFWSGKLREQRILLFVEEIW